MWLRLVLGLCGEQRLHGVRGWYLWSCSHRLDVGCVHCVPARVLQSRCRVDCVHQLRGRELHRVVRGNHVPLMSCGHVHNDGEINSLRGVRLGHVQLTVGGERPEHVHRMPGRRVLINNKRVYLYLVRRVSVGNC